jgi:hypothetical protein
MKSGKTLVLTIIIGWLIAIGVVGYKMFIEEQQTSEKMGTETKK